MISAIANSPFTHFLHTLPWLPQALETIHMTFHSLLVGAAVLLALRLVGFGDGIPISRLARYLLPACWVAVVVLAISGTLMFTLNAEKYVADQYFLWKIAVVAEGILLLAFTHWMVRRHANRWDAAGAAPVPVRLVAGATISVWIAAITLGRFIYIAL